MSLTLLTGTFPSLENALVARIRQKPPTLGRPLTVVTASGSLRDRLQRVLAVENGLSLLNIEFHTFFSLAREVLRGEAGPPALENELFHERLVQGLLAADGMAPGRAAALAPAARATLRDLDESGVDPDQFEEHFEDLEPPEGRGPALRRMLSLQRVYRRRMALLGLETPADTARRAARLIEGDPSFLEGRDFLYYGFYDLNGAQADFFSAVARHADLTVFFPCRLGHPADRFAERFLELKIRAGGSSPERLPPTASALGQAVDLLFDPEAAPGTPPAPESLTIVSASGERDEVWRVAKEILRLRKEIPGLAFEDIGVVARNLAPYRDFLAAVFDENAVPLEQTSVGFPPAHPAAVALRALARLCLDDFSVEDVVELLRSPFLKNEAGNAANRRAGARFLERWGLGAGRGRLTGLLRASRGADASGEGLPDLPLEAAQTVEGLLNGTAGMSREPVRKTWSGWVGEFLKLTEAWFDFELSEGGGEAGESLRSAIQSLASLDRIEPPRDGWDIGEALGRALETAEFPSKAKRGVRLRDAMSARGESFRVLFLIGLKEGSFPRRIREDPLLTDDLRRVLQDPGGYWILPKKDGYDEEKLIFASLVGAARERLIVSYPRSREDGRAEVPSLYLRELCRVTGRRLEAGISVPRPPLARWSSVPGDLLTLEESAALALRPGEKASLNSLGPWEARLRPAAERFPGMTRFDAPGDFDGLAGEPRAVAKVYTERGLTPTALDDFAQCPFRFFARRVLNLPDDRPVDARRLPPWVKGRLYHAVLERFGRSAIEKGAWLEPAACEALLRDAVHSVLDDTGPLAWMYPALLWELWREEMAVALDAFVKGEREELAATGYRPVAVEKTLEGPALFGPPGLRWRGRPDRVDEHIADGSLRAVDYKINSRKESLLDLVREGRLHQPLAYLDLLKASGKRTASAEFHGVEDNVRETLTGEMAEAEGKPWRETAAALWALLIGGRFLIRPDEKRQCLSCPYPGVCRKAHVPTRRRAERAVGPPVLHPLPLRGGTKVGGGLSRDRTRHDTPHPGLPAPPSKDIPVGEAIKSSPLPQGMKKRKGKRP